jgi:hypothetical protein
MRDGESTSLGGKGAGVYRRGVYSHIDGAMKSKWGMKSLGVLSSVMVRTDALSLSSEGGIDKADKAAGDHQRPQGGEVEVAIPISRHH